MDNQRIASELVDMAERLASDRTGREENIKSRIKEVAKLIGKAVAKVQEFSATGETFQAIEGARQKAHSLGYTSGSMESNNPIALSKDASRIAKWRNISRNEYHRIDGFLISNDMREGDAYLVILK